MKIFTDADEVLWKLLPKWVYILNKLYDKNVKLQDITQWSLGDVFNLSWPELEVPLKESSFWDNDLKPTDGAQEYIKKLIDEGNEIIVVTAASYESFPAKVDLIHRLFPEIPTWNIYRVNDKTCLKGDLIVDDNPSNLEGDFKYKLLFTAHHNINTEAKTGIVRVDTWKDVYSFVKEHESGRD